MQGHLCGTRQRGHVYILRGWEPFSEHSRTGVNHRGEHWADGSHLGSWHSVHPPCLRGSAPYQTPREAAACKARPRLHLNPNNARSPAAAALACGQGSPCQPVLSAPFPAFPHPLLNHNKRSLVSSPIKATGAGLVKTNSYKRFPLNKTQIFGLYIPRNENKHKKKERD